MSKCNFSNIENGDDNRIYFIDFFRVNIAEYLTCSKCLINYDNYPCQYFMQSSMPHSSVKIQWHKLLLDDCQYIWNTTQAMYS